MIIKEQTGFRLKEEATAQATCLYEILQSRKYSGLNTYCAFLDLYKAFDQVSHQVINMVLSQQGFHGRILKFVEKSYRNASCVLRANMGLLKPF